MIHFQSKLIEIQSDNEFLFENTNKYLTYIIFFLCL